MITYTYTPEYGYVSSDGWTEALDPVRNDDELELITGLRCSSCGRHQFDLVYLFAWDVCDCKEPSFA